MKSNEYLEQRLEVAEAIINSMGEIIIAHLPAIQPHMINLSKQWDAHIRQIESAEADRQK
jgi:hypothetical protein